MSIEALGPRSLHCHDGGPLCVLDSGYPMYPKRMIRDIFGGMAVVFCENGCCTTEIPFREFKTVMEDLDEALRWETSLKFSELCDKEPNRIVIVPMLVQHAPSKWSRAIEWDEVDEEEILRRLD